MLLSDIPAWFAKRFGQDAGGTYIRTVPLTTADPAAASFTIGFPPQTFTDEGAGGTPPDGRDFNGILNFLSAWAQWQGAGGGVPFNATIASNGGYPKGARLMSSVNPALVWVNQIDGNTTNPDGGGAADWSALTDLGHTYSSSNGHITVGKLILNFGTTSLTDSSGYKDIVFDKPFTSGVFASGATNLAGSPAYPASWPGVSNFSTTGMRVGMSVSGPTGGAGVPAPSGTAATWWALGV